MKEQMQLPSLSKIKRFFPKHRKENISKFILLVQLVMHCRTVCIYKLRSSVGLLRREKDLNLDSVYTNLIRFFRIKEVDEFCLGVFRLVLFLLGDVECSYVALDRTNWKIGSVNVNILAIGLVLRNGVFIPFLWQNLEKRGNSSTAERKALLKRFLDAWGKTKAEGLILLGDREFVGRAWFEHLSLLHFDFTIRLRKDEYWGELAEAMGKDVGWVAKKIKRDINRKGFFSHKITVKGVGCHYTAVKSKVGKGRKKKEELLILLTTEPDVEKAVEHYGMRWGIEVFFGHVKKDGFNLEDLNLNISKRIHLMMCVVAVAYVVAVKNGCETERDKKPKFKKYKNYITRVISLFRKGLEEFKNKVHNIWDFILFLKNSKPCLQDDFKNWTKSVQ